MAEHEISAVSHDMQQHLDTWRGFIRVLFFGASFVILVLVLLALFFL